MPITSATSHCSTWPSTASSPDAILSASPVRDVTHGNQVLSRAMVIQPKRQRPVQFELNEMTRTTVAAWIDKAGLTPEGFLFPSRLHESPHVSTRQYARIVDQWVMKNLRAVHLLIGHSKLESSVRYLGIEADDALEISAQPEI